MEDNMNSRNIRKRLMAYFMALLILVTTFFPTQYDHVNAGAAVGASGTISGTGSVTNLAGGIFELNNVMFRVGISKDPAFYHSIETDEATTINEFSRRYPKLSDSSIYMKGLNYRDFAGTDFKLAEYNAGTKALDTYDDAVSKSRVISMSYEGGGKPWNHAKSLLSGYSFGGNAKYSDLLKEVGGVARWKTVVGNNIPLDGANHVWSYIMSKNGGNYEITKRMDAMISDVLATKKLSALTPAEQADVSQGYLALMITTWRLVPDALKGEWEQAIEAYMVKDGWSKTGSPQTIVVDTATVVLLGSVPTAPKVVLSTLDYFQYYTAVKTSYDLDSPKKQSAANTHDLLKQIVNNTIIEEGSGSTRISNMYDAGNAFSHGAAAVVNPNYRFSTSSGSGSWDSNTVVDGIMDTLTLGNSSSGKIIGFNYVGYHFLTIDIEDPLLPSAAIKFNTDEKQVVIPSAQEILGKPVKLIVQHDGTNETAVNSWVPILELDPYQTVNVKITWVRKVTNPTISSTTDISTNPAAYDKGHISGFATDGMWFKRWIEGSEKFTIIDSSTLSEPITENQTKLYTYTPTVTFTYMNRGKVATYTALANSDSTLFKRPSNPPQLISYTSEPSAYAEFKNGSPDNEEFDAMAGVPSNKRMYLGVGGSEFIVDVELEYKKDIDSVWRTYQSNYTAIDSEYKDRDNAKTGSIGGQTVDLHNGGTYTKSWSGSILNKGVAVTTNGSGNVSATSSAVPDRSAYDTAKTAAQAYVTTVNGTTLSYTSASEPRTRTQTGWSGGITTDSSPDPQSVTTSNSCFHSVSTGTPPVSSQVPDPCTTTASPSGATNFAITVTFTVPAHILCGPECTYTLPAIQDTWKQRVNFDYMKISRVEVYKISEGRITKVDNVFGAGNSQLKATIKQGDPNIFTNIAQKNSGGNDISAQSSEYGRIRYSLDWAQHDVVVYNEGQRTNKSDGRGSNGSSYSSAIGQSHARAQGIIYSNGSYSTTKDNHKALANAIDEARPEFTQFNTRRTTMNTATIISDMLILQTSSGDQSVLYFDKKTTPKQAQEQFDPVDSTKEDLWDNNPNSAAKWSKNQIYVGSYNGNFSQTGNGASLNKKYWGFSQPASSFISSRQGDVATAFDSNGVGVRAGTPRLAKPSKLSMYETKDLVTTTQNGAYPTGDADVFYERLLEYKTSNPYSPEYPGTPLGSHLYTAQTQSNYGSKLGLVVEAPYSDNHTKVNDIVIHTPVSSEDAMVVSLDPARDQRTSTPVGGAAGLLADQNSLKVCPLDPALCEFRVLNCKHGLDVVVADIDFENINASQVYNKTKGVYIPYGSSAGITTGVVPGFGTGNSLKAFGTRASLNFSDIGLTNDPKTTVLVEMDFWMPNTPTSGGSMLISFGSYDFFVPAGQGVGTWNTGNGWERRLDDVNFVNKKMRLGLQFSFGSVADSKVFIDGVEQTYYSKLNPSARPEGHIGTQLNIGSWTTDSSYPAQFNIDNLKITKKGGTFYHTDACYLDTTVHDTNWIHVHDASCYNAQGVAVCQNMPLNTLSQNNSHVYGSADVADYMIKLDSAPVAPVIVPFNQSFGYTGAMQTFTAPNSGNYTFKVWGASGGTSTSGYVAGKGAYSESTVSLTAGEVIKVLVGGQGQNLNSSSGSGGGGSFTSRSNNTPIAVAGGGGGTYANYYSGTYYHGQATQNVVNFTPYTSAVSTGYGGFAGYNGWGYPSTSGAGGGFYGDGMANSYSGGGSGGQAFTSGGGVGVGYTLGVHGGFGGGGGTNYVGGGGGGYTGGNAGTGHDSLYYTGGGGGSYFTGSGSYAKGGWESMPSTSGATQTGQVGNGYVNVSSNGGSGGGVETRTPGATLGQLKIYGELSRVTGVPANPTWGGGYSLGDVLVGQNSAYVAHLNLNYVSQYNKNSDGTLSSRARTNSWYDYDTTINSISRSNSSVPSAYAMFVENGVDKLAGWSMDGATIYTWDIINNIPSNRQAYAAPNVMSAYSRGSWDGGSYIYFFNRNDNGLYRWNIQSKGTQPTLLTYLSSGTTYISPSWTGSGMLVDAAKGEVYSGSGGDQSTGFLSAWRLSDGAYLGTIKQAQLQSGGVTAISGEAGNLSLTALHRNIGYYFYAYSNTLVQVDLGLQPSGNSSAGVYRRWDFNNTLDGFTNGTGAISPTATDLSNTITSGDNFFYSPSNLNITNLNNATDEIEIRLKNNSSGTSNQIYFATSTLNAITESSMLPFTISANDTGYKTYRIRPNGHANWSGTLNSFRIDLANGVTSGSVLVDYIKINSVSTEPTLQGYPLAQLLGANWQNYLIETSTSTGVSGSKTFNNTNTGNTGSNTNNSSGVLTGAVSMSGGMYYWTVPSTGTYTIEAQGAQGGGRNGYNGGLGAKTKGDFSLVQGEVIKILVGQAGLPSNYDPGDAGGGGGTFVTKNTNSPLVIAGGGGGAYPAANIGGQNASETNNGGAGTTTSAGAGGANGSGGGQGYASGSGGGLTGNGTNSSGWNLGGGTSFTNGGLGGIDAYGFGSGGFGGGGTGHGYWTGGGGGGGYSGGGGAGNSNGVGGGGGSYNGGSNQSNTAGVRSGQGLVTITGVSTNTSTSALDKVGIKRDILSFPQTMPDGAPNPLYTVMASIGGSTSLGAFEGVTGSGVSTVAVTSPKNGIKVRALKLLAGANVPYITTADLNLKVGGNYTLEFDYWSDANGTPFDVDLYPDDLPQIMPVANMAVQHMKQENITSTSANMPNAILRIFNDRAIPNPANVYITGIKLYAKVVPNTHVHNANCITTKTLTCTEPHHAGDIARSYDSSDTSKWDFSGDVVWDGSKNAWKATGYSLMYLKDAFAPKVNTGRKYTIEVTMMKSNNQNKGFYWGGGRVTASKAYLPGYSGYYDYSAAENALPADGLWTTYKIEGKTGTSNDRNGWSADGTAFFKVGGILNNWGANTQVTWVKDIKFYYENGEELMPRQVPVIDPASINHYDGSSTVCWDACGIDANHKTKSTVTLPNGTTVNNATFINLDYGFQVYYPNNGDFSQQPQLKGISSITTSRGKGYVDDMDTTQYTAVKRVRFAYNVIYNGKLYRSGAWINLPVNQTYYDFYAVLANREAIAATIEYEAVAINGRPIGAPVNDNSVSSTNRERAQDYSSYHGAYKMSYIDLVGRIGNFAVSDTEDFRFSNLFKQDSTSGKWIVEGLVKEVDSYKQKKHYADLFDIRGMGIETTGKRLNTYGTQPWLEKAPLAFPVNPKDNDQAALKEQFIKVGYDVLGDISTIGNYQEGLVRALPYYYKLDLATGAVIPLDVYVKNGDDYKPVNKYRAADSGTIPPDIYPYNISLDWTAESPRRNFTMDEAIITDRMAEIHGEYIIGLVSTGGTMETGVTGVKRMSTPDGNFVDLGTAQRIVADKKARTFIGTSDTYGVEKNLGGAISEDDWNYSAQRWHLKFGLPSSAVFVEAGKSPTKANLDATKAGNAVVLLTSDIISIGSVYTLRWQQPGISSFTVAQAGKTTSFNLGSSGLPPVLAIYDLTKTALIDVTVQGSH
jgi:hypothetical protein